jgi:outer membrane protein OmpA-like peptidoglycan-associated protein
MPQAAPTTIGFRIPFAFNSAELLPEGRPFLDQLGQVMQSEPQLSLAVEGHTDAHGGDAYNKVLSQKRAKAVQAYLVHTWHVDASRLSVVGKGKAEPLTADPFDAENRRVQFRPLG